MHLTRNKMVEAWLDDNLHTDELLKLINPRNEPHIIGYECTHIGSVITRLDLYEECKRCGLIGSSLEDFA